MTREEFIVWADAHIRSFIRFVFQWISTDAEVLGYILAVLHILIVIGSSTSFLLAYTLYPTFWFQTFVLAGLILVWSQHIFLGGCILTISEEKFTNSYAPSIPYIKKIWSYIFNTELQYALIQLVFAETIVVGCFTLQFIGRCSYLLNKKYRKEY